MPCLFVYLRSNYATRQPYNWETTVVKSSESMAVIKQGTCLAYNWTFLREMKAAVFLLILVADVVESAGIRLPLSVVPTTSQGVRRSLKHAQSLKATTGDSLRQEGLDWYSLFSSRINPASTGIFGYESLQLSIALGTPRKSTARERWMKLASRYEEKFSVPLFCMI